MRHFEVRDILGEVARDLKEDPRLCVYFHTQALYKQCDYVLERESGIFSKCLFEMSPDGTQRDYRELACTLTQDDFKSVRLDMESRFGPFVTWKIGGDVDPYQGRYRVAVLQLLGVEVVMPRHSVKKYYRDL